MPTNPSIEALLELQVIDQQRQKLRQARVQLQGKVAKATQDAAAAEASAAAAQSEVEKNGALIRQYSTDIERCDASIAELRAQQMNAKTNKEYMAIINGIETARLEKNHREQSLKELNARIQALQAKADEAKTAATQLRSKITQAEPAATASAQPTAEEAALEKQYQERKSQVDAKFLEAYERLVASGHKMPLMKVDPTTRSTPYGARISHNQVEQIRAGQLVICSGTNQILYLP
ncbi:MAG: hypothetical protein H0W72_13130 [Planctomycetes bacterium]|nr:hypothetical protein [Planctomycetota bacterium]